MNFQEPYFHFPQGWTILSSGYMFTPMWGLYRHIPSIAAAVLVGILSSAGAQETVGSIAELWSDVDEDGVPDLVGQEVLVSGWFSVDSHHLDSSRMDLFFQDDSGGLMVLGGGGESKIGEGLRAIISGVLSNEAHTLVIHSPVIQTFPRKLRLIKPEDLSDNRERSWESLLGRLVKIKGVVKSRHRSSAGLQMDVEVGENPEDLVTLRWSGNHKAPPAFNAFKEGHRIQVVGILVGKGGHYAHAPYPEIWPRYEEDLEHLGFTPRFYLNAWMGFGVLALFALLCGVSLRTQVKSKTADLREVQQRFQAVYESAADAIVIADKNGKVRSLNPATETMTGFDGDAIRSHSFVKLLAGDRKSQWQAISESIQKGKAYSAEHQLIRRDKDVLDVEVKVSRVNLTGKEYVLMLIRDITERKRAQENLLKEKERLSVTLNSVVDAVITTNTEGLAQSLNPAAERMLGKSEAECVNGPLSDLCEFIQDGQKILHPVNKVMKKRRVVDLPVHTELIRHSDNHRFFVSGSSSPMTNEQGHVTGVVLAVRDITDRMKIEEEQLKASKLESIGILAGGIAHDFNNIMTSVAGNIELAFEGLEGEASEEIKESLRQASESSIRARALTSQLLTFARGGEPVKARCDVKDLLDEVHSLALSGTTMRVEKIIAEDVWPVDVDKNQILQALSNIVINAKEACGASGTMYLRAGNMRVDTYAGTRSAKLEPGEYIHLTITDTGEGIAEENVDQIFDPYFSTKKEGSGLGLSAAYSIITHHQGCIEVQSEKGQGTTFTIYLPRSSARHPIEKSVNSAHVHKQGKILVLDDEAAIRRVATHFLTKSGCSCETAETGEEAVEKYICAMKAGDPFDLVLMDLTIPGGMGGKEAMQKLKEFDPKIKGIVSSGYSNDPVMASHQEYGFMEVVPKPYSKTELVEAVNRVMGEEGINV